MEIYNTFVDFGISTDRSPLSGNMADVFSSDTMYDIREFLEVVDENFRPWNEFTANPYNRATVEGMNKYKKGWLSGHTDKQPLGLCIPSKPPKSEDSEDMLWDVLRILVRGSLCCGLWVACLWNKEGFCKTKSANI